MKRNILDSEFIETDALSQITEFHSAIVQEVRDAVQGNKVVVVGMAQNPVVKKARKVLTEAGIPFKYLEYGSYFKGWKPRLAIKIWSGWPTYPQVFVNGKLIGGCAETMKAIEQGKIK
jgi:monothiol glutaredoxin